MKNKHRTKVYRLIFAVTLFFLIIAISGILLGSKYIDKQLLKANKNNAIDIALLVKNNFKITNKEVKYLKSLTFNEMEVDKINKRLMDVGNGVKLTGKINNVYIISPLKKKEMKYKTDKKTSEFFGYEENTVLNGIWLLNGKINEKGKFQVAKRDDIYRYTLLTEEQEEGIKRQEAFGEYSNDAWGNFITGYAPVYTVEGEFVGLLGIDMDPNKYQNDAQNMILILVIGFILVSLAIIFLFLYFYFKYIKAKEGQSYFEFYSRMSHDMRTPMNGILGMAILSEDEKNIEVLHNNFKKVKESGEYMLGLINDILDVQKLDAGKLKLNPKLCNCREVVQSLISMIKIEAVKKNIDFKVINNHANLDSFSYIDELRIQQIFMNIASNAIKFTPEGGTVTFKLECLGKEGNIKHDRFQIIDTGIGMSEKFIKDHLFKPFEQEQNSVTTQYAGSGLGLSIVKDLVELMNGRIEVESKLGEGSTFTVYLDFEEVNESKVTGILNNAKDRKIKNNALNGINILLCEDNDLNAEIASKILEKFGAKVIVARNGEEGVKLFKGSTKDFFHIILMDIRMPVMDGLTATKTIRSENSTYAKNIPIIALTANTYEEDIKNCMNAGMNSHIAKPLDSIVMCETILKLSK